MKHAHITINGRPYCEHTACVAGMQDAKASGVSSCDYPSNRSAENAALALRAIGRNALVVPGPCPIISA
jgi:hypothetical protein